MPVPIGFEQIRKLSQLGETYKLRRKIDGVTGLGWISRGFFRLFINGCNVAGDKDDVLFIPDKNDSCWVIQAHVYGVDYEKVE